MANTLPFTQKFLKRLQKIDRGTLEKQAKDLYDAVALRDEILGQIGDGLLIVSQDLKLKYVNYQASLWLEIPGNALNAPLSQSVEDTELLKFIRMHVSDLQTTLVGDVSILTPKELGFRIHLIPLSSGDILIRLAERVTGQDTQPRYLEEKRMEALLRLTAGIAHEIGNPLAAIDIHLNLLKKEIRNLDHPKSLKIDSAVEVIHEETRRLDRIVRNFLKATRNPPLRFRMENINLLMDETLAVLQPELASNGIELKLKLDKTIPVFLMDRERLRPLFLNIIKNAIEAMDKPRKMLSIQTLKRKNAVVLTFQDNGCGIHESSLPHIFDAYYTTKTDGSGLGLMTVYNAVRDHGGKIDVRSKVGKGSSFNITLPVRLPHLQLPEYPVKNKSGEGMKVKE